jgi:nitroreductase/NAD-dependent dihydropyrimidine dehydrogenase PreA subunit
MPKITIDPDLCKRDGLCSMVCVHDIFRQGEKGTVPKIVRPESCFRCGHCVAVCPHGAISHSDFPEGAVTPIRTENLPTYDQVVELIHGRRSMRRFEDRPVEKEDVEKLLEAARFAPSGHNEQPTEFVVIQDKEALDEIRALTFEALKKMMGSFKSPIGRMMMGFMIGKRKAAMLGGFAPEVDALPSLYEGGKDLVLNHAPTLILFVGDDAAMSPLIDANLALQNATLAAEAMGLGCFYTGFITVACDRDRSIPEYLSLPDTHKIFGGLGVGYPRVKYKSWPERNPAKVKWV